MYTRNEILNNYLVAGPAKTRQPIRSMFALGILAGAFIAFGALASQVASVTIATASAARLVAACVFPAGLSMVILCGAELFTGNCLLVIPALHKKCTFGEVLRNWVVVYAGNFVGSLLVAAGAAAGHIFGLFDGKLAESAATVAAAKMTIAPGDAFFRGILCDVLVCVAVWVAMASKHAAGKVLGLFFPVMVFVLCGFEHSVANMYYFPAGCFASLSFPLPTPLSFPLFAARNLLPVTLGNIVGGSLAGLILGGPFPKSRTASRS